MGWKESGRTDLCLALGSSIMVTPASEMPSWVAQRHKRDSTKGLVIVNLQATPCDGQAALRINGFVDNVMERVEAILMEQGILPKVPRGANVVDTEKDRSNEMAIDREKWDEMITS